MAEVRVVHVGTELFGRELPVALQHPSMHPANHLGAAGAAAEIAVDVPEHVAQVVAQRWRIGIPVAEHLSVDSCKARYLEGAPFALVKFVAIAVFFVRNGDEVAGEVVTPAMIGAGECAGVAAIRPADAHPAMAALIQKRPNRSVLLPHDQHGIFGHVSGKEVARFFQHALMAQEQPRPGEDAFEFELVDGWIAIDSRIEAAGFFIHQAAQIRTISARVCIHSQPRISKSQRVLDWRRAASAASARPARRPSIAILPLGFIKALSARGPRLRRECRGSGYAGTVRFFPPAPARTSSATASDPSRRSAAHRPRRACRDRGRSRYASAESSARSSQPTAPGSADKAARPRRAPTIPIPAAPGCIPDGLRASR